MRHPSLSIALLTCVASALPAQIKISVLAKNDAGVTIERGNNTKTIKTLPPNTNFTKFTSAAIKEQKPVYTSHQSYVYPPFNLGPIKSGRVKFAAAATVRKKSGHKSLHTTGSKTGTAGAQKYEVSISSAKPTQIRIDWLLFGTIYDAASLSVKMKMGKIANKSWSISKPGTQRDDGYLYLPVSGTIKVEVEVTGMCKPGTGGTGHASYEGYNGSFQMNILEVGNGSFKLFGTGCSKGKISANGPPVRGAFLEVKLTGDAPNQAVGLMIGTSKDKHGKVKLPLDLSNLGAKGCFMNVGNWHPWYLTTDAKGNAMARTYMSAFLPSGTYYVQWMVWDPKNPKVPPKTSRAAELKF